MGIIFKALSVLKPKGQAHTLTGGTLSVYKAFAASLEVVRSDIKKVIAESQPGTAVDTLQEWYKLLSLSYDPTLPLDARQKKASLEYTTQGTMTLLQLQTRIQELFPDVYITEFETSSKCGVAECGVSLCGDYDPVVNSQYFLVHGSVNTQQEYNSLRGLINKYKAAQLIPWYTISVQDEKPWAYTGLARCGVAITGSMEDEE